MFNKKRLKEVAKCPSLNDLAISYGRKYNAIIDIGRICYKDGAKEIIKRIEDKLDFYCDRPNEFYGAIERMVKELKGE